MSHGNKQKNINTWKVKLKITNAWKKKLIPHYLQLSKYIAAKLKIFKTVCFLTFIFNSENWIPVKSR